MDSNFKTMEYISLVPANTKLKSALQHKLDNKTKPRGSLGLLEEIAMRAGMIQNTLNPVLNKPVMLTVGADHLICEEGVSPCPTEITWQQMLNFLKGGGGISLFCNHYGMDLWVVDAGVNYDFEPHPKLIDAKIRKGTRNFLHEPAMTEDECLRALNNGREIVRKFAAEGSNVIGFGEMGIGNTTPASALMSIYCNLNIDDCVGPGSGLNAEGVTHKANVIKQAFEKHGISNKPIENLARFGGLEIATIAGGMLEAAAQKMIIIVDGFITTSAFLAAHAINPIVNDYSFFSHQSDEQGHIKMIKHVKGKPILQLGLRLGEGTGAAIALSVIEGALAMINDMTSFDEGKVTNTTHI